MSRTAFHTGQTVVALTNTQGLRKGWEYQVVGVQEEYYPFGTFVTYSIESEAGDRLTVANAHIVLGAAGK